MLLGSGELGKEVTIEAKRLGCDVIAYRMAVALAIGKTVKAARVNAVAAAKKVKIISA